MAITANLYYTGTNGAARKFAEEMEASGTADAIRAEGGATSATAISSRSTIRRPSCSSMRGATRKRLTCIMLRP